MKKYRISSLVLLLLIVWQSLAVGASAAENTAYNWYVKRSANKQPELSAEQRMILDHGGYYLDTKVNEKSEDKVLYLTFDAGYENGNVSKILDVLKAENVPGAFFILDHPILKNTDLVLRMANEGHLVCNHSKNHKDMTTLTPEEMEKNLKALETIYEQKTGKTMAKYFRFPEGRYSEEALKTAEKLGYKSIFWSLAHADWDNDHQPDPEKSIQKLLANTHNGAVILLHPTSATNVEILPTLIREWKAQGYRFGTLDELTK